MQEGLLGKHVWAGGNQGQECQRDWGDQLVFYGREHPSS